MSVIKYIGRITNFRGKPLWEILGNLKSFGVGRVVVRSVFERYPEKTFFRVLKVEALPNTENRKAKVWVEKVFRGRKYKDPVLIESVSYKADYRLLSKKEEPDYCQVLEEHSNAKKLIAPYMEVPPLVRELFKKETGKEEIKMKVHLKNTDNKTHRLAREGEKPDMELTINLGKLKSPSLYEGCNM